MIGRVIVYLLDQVVIDEHSPMSFVASILRLLAAIDLVDGVVEVRHGLVPLPLLFLLRTLDRVLLGHFALMIKSLPPSLNFCLVVSVLLSLVLIDDPLQLCALASYTLRILVQVVHLLPQSEVLVVQGPIRCLPLNSAFVIINILLVTRL